MKRYGIFVIALILAFSVSSYVCCLPKLHHHASSQQSCCAEKKAPCCIKKTARSGQVAGDNDNTLRSLVISATSTSEPVTFPYINYNVRRAMFNDADLASKLNDLIFSRIFISRKDFV